MFEASRREVLLTATAAAAIANSGAAMAFSDPATDASGATWDLTDLYSTPAAWETERQALMKAIPTLVQYKGRLGQGASTLRAAFEAQSALSKRLGRLYIYASLKSDEDVRIAANQERKQKARDAYTAYSEATSWVVPELIAVGASKLRGFIASDPGLKKFAFGIEDTLRLAPHTLDANGERLLALAGTPLSGPSDISEQLRSSDIPRPTVKLSDGREVRLDDQGYTNARSAQNRADRKLVFDKFWGSYKAFENSLGTSLAARVQGSIFSSKARNYKSSLDAALSDSNLPEGVYRTLIAETNRGLPVLHRYFALRQRMLGLPDMGYWDIYPPLVKSDRKYSLDEMRALTLEAIKPLGADYVAQFDRASRQKWMDPFPRKGKTSGAYMSGGAYDVHPYLLLNLSDQYDGLSTYAHEWGHAMHTLLAKAAQPYELAGYPTFTAEVASTAQELMLVHTLLDRAQTKEDKLFFLGQLMENYRGTFFRQAMFGEFQLAIHEMAERGEGLSGEKMSALYIDLLKRYHGPKVRIEPDYAVEWAFIPHFYRTFYVYQYATSITAANFFADSVMKGGGAERDRYLAVLKAGGSDYGYNLLKIGGLDMASPTPYRTLVANFSSVLDQAERLLA